MILTASVPKYGMCSCNEIGHDVVKELVLLYFVAVLITLDTCYRKFLRRLQFFPSSAFLSISTIADKFLLKYSNR